MMARSLNIPSLVLCSKSTDWLNWRPYFSMRLEGFPKLAVNIIRKDWNEYRTPVFVVAGGMTLAALITIMLSPHSDFAKGALIGVGLGGAYGFAQSCFFNERQRGTLVLLLSLPVTPLQLVLAKYASAFSMALFTINIPGLLLRDLRFLLFSNIAALLFTSICMAATVVSDKPWAPQLPLWIVMIAVLPAPRLLSHSSLPQTVHRLLSHPVWIAGLGLLLISSIVYISARIFEKALSP